MRGIGLVVLIALAACQTLPYALATTFFPPSLQAFELSDECPHMCWLGINPGVTTLEQAKSQIYASPQFDRSWDQVSGDGIYTRWYTDRFRYDSCEIRIQAVGGRVKSVNIAYSSFTMQQFLGLLGQPDSISIGRFRAPDAEYISYAVFFPDRNVVIEVSSGSPDGPNPDDRITSLSLNPDHQWGADPTDALTFISAPKPWIGYGHLSDYLPGTEIIPTNLP